MSSAPYLSLHRDIQLLLRKRFFPHQQAVNVLDELEFLLTAQSQTGQGYGVRLVGQTDCGKTSICLEMVRRHPPAWSDDRWLHPVLYVHLPERANLKKIYQNILKALGDPAYSEGSVDQLQVRAKEMLAACGVRMLIIDEPHHLTESRSEGARVALVQLGKVLIDIGMCIVVAGVQSIDDLTRESSELARRYPTRFEVAPYDLTSAAQLRMLRGFCDALGSELEGLEPALLGSEDVWFAPLAATSAGAVGVIVKVIELGSVEARQRGAKALTLTHTASIWDRLLAQSDEVHLQHLRHSGGKLSNLFRDAELALEMFGQLVGGLK